MAAQIDFSPSAKCGPYGDGEGLDELSQPWYDILTVYLQPNSSVTKSQVIGQIAALLTDPPLDPTLRSEDDVAQHENFLDTCILVAGDIPYHHESQLKFVRLISTLSSLDCMVGKTFDKIDTHDKKGTPVYFPVKVSWCAYQWARDTVHEPDEVEMWQHVNQCAFMALLSSHGVDSWRWKVPIIWRLREALEEEGLSNDNRQSALIAGAAMWFLNDGSALFRLCQTPVSLEEGEDPDHLNPGPLWKEAESEEGVKKNWWSMARWRFWRQRLETLSQKESLNSEARGLANKAVVLMQAFEDTH